MKPKALIVEDDNRIVESIEDTLLSIGHEHDWATNQYDAELLLKKSNYDYVMLDLQIPASPKRGRPDREFGCNLLRNIQRIKGRGQVPVIVMTGDGAECVDLTTELYANGAAEFIAKPFSRTGRTLASVIRKVFDTHPSPASLPERSQPAGVRTSQPTPFQSGEMVFHSEGVTLCGVTVLVNSRAKQMRKILDTLRQQSPTVTYVALSGPELASTLRLRGGQNGVAGAVRDFRRKVAEKLLQELGLVCGTQDVIRSGGPGYRLHEWILARDSVT